MSLALLQKGTGGALCVYAGPMPDRATDVPDTTSPPGMPRQALVALGPVPCVVSVNARGSETAEQILAYAQAQTARRLWWAALIGFSRGCQKVRELWLAGTRPCALVLADGLAAHFPPTDAQLDYAEHIARIARTGALLLVITHTYVALGPQVTSTSLMAQIASGWTLDPPPRGVSVRRVALSERAEGSWRGGLIVYSTGSSASDRVAHGEQATAILPIALRAHVRELVELPMRPDASMSAPATTSSTPRWEYVTRQGTRWIARRDDAEAGAAPKPAVASPAPAPAEVFLIGDSLAQGFSPHLAELARANGLTFRFKGRQGSAIGDWLPGPTQVDALPDALPTTNPAMILVCLGTNDMAHRERCRAGELLLVMRRRGYSGAIAWIGPPRVPVDSSTFRADLGLQCGYLNVRVFDSQTLDVERAPDRIHMTPAGYRAWAESIAAWVPFSALAGGAPSSSNGPSGDPSPGPSRGSDDRPQLRDRFYVTRLGELSLDDYVARVVTGEVGGFVQPEALKAQAIAARTFVQRALRDDSRLGTPDKPLKNGEDFQVAAPAATEFAVRATRATQGGIILHRGRLILANYVAGAPWAPGASKGSFSPKYPTEKYVTYNAGLAGSAVSPTSLADLRRSDNRGCMSQNGARALALRGWKWPQILRFFYGEDIDFTVPEPADPSVPRVRPVVPPPTPATPARRSDDVLPLLAFAALAYRFLG
jgi:lysophospholipase L1-like esterase